MRMIVGKRTTHAEGPRRPCTVPGCTCTGYGPALCGKIVSGPIFDPDSEDPNTSDTKWFVAEFGKEPEVNCPGCLSELAKTETK